MASRLGNIPTASVRRRISRLRRSTGLFDQIWPHILREFGECQHVCPGSFEVLGDVGEFLGCVVQEPVELRLDGVGIGLVVRGEWSIALTAGHMLLGVTDMSLAV